MLKYAVGLDVRTDAGVDDIETNVVHVWPDSLLSTYIRKAIVLVKLKVVRDYSHKNPDGATIGSHLPTPELLREGSAPSNSMINDRDTD